MNRSDESLQRGRESVPRALWAVLGSFLIVLGVAGCGSSGHHVGNESPSRPTASSVPSGPTYSSPPSVAGTEAPSGGSGVATDRAPAAWPGYHDDQSRTGAVAGPSFADVRKAWTASLGGVVHGQVVAADGRIFAATEENRVVALDPHDGRILWSRTLGRPLTNVDAIAGCGDIDPLGITSTPVIDTRSDTMYVVAEISTGGSAVHHQLEGFSLATGARRLSEDVDPPLPAGEQAVNLLQRTSLAISHRRIFVSYGGNDGDCGSYHGWVVGVDETGSPHEDVFEVASDGEGGAIWEAGGAPAVDATGDIYVSTGNANPDPPEGGPDPKKYTESVVKLTPDLRVLASYKDTVAGGDEDLSTGNPVLVGHGEVFAIGKTDIGYLLRTSNLSEVTAIKGICGSNPDGGPAYDATTNRIYVPCEGGGIETVDLTTRSAGPTFGGSSAGANGAPILIGDELWATNYHTGYLYEYGITGPMTARQTLAVGPMATFTSPSTALGLLLVPTDTGVIAYEGATGLPSSP
jgi:polyvinyl alcohol dehydrogenase (cytochrome)